MKATVKRVTAILLAVLFSTFVLPFSVSADPTEAEGGGAYGVEEGALALNCKSAVLMEATTGEILYVQNADEALPPASVTKIMTLLLVMEELDAGRIRPEDLVSVSENAASMGGSQVFLEAGEAMSVEELIKCVVIASANDAAVALAEHVAGTVPSFVERMNRRAAQLGMEATHFENATGLDDTATAHLTSARDIALMSRALLAHPDVLKYSATWMDTARNGTISLTNTNRLVRFYRGCTGLKTGSTDKAGFCVSATAERDGLSLICVIMGAETGDERNRAASTLLDWGFANYALYRLAAGEGGPIRVTGGTEALCGTRYGEVVKVLPKEDVDRVKVSAVLPATLAAPVSKGESVGRIELLLDGRVIAQGNVLAAQTVERITLFDVFRRMLAKFLLI